MIRTAATVFFLLITFPLFSQSDTLLDNNNYDDLNIAKESWNIGVSTYSGLNLDKRYEYLLNALPLLIQDEISNLHEHILSEDELHHLRTQFLTEKTIAVEKEKSQIHSQRDALLFSDLEKEELEEKYEEYSESIKNKEADLKEWNELNIEDIRIAETLPILIKNISDNETRLLTPRTQIQRFMESEDIDLLINGTVEKLDTMLFLNIEALMQHSEEPVFTISEIVSEEEINNAVSDAAIGLRTVVLGRSWSELSVSVFPENALLLIDGDSKGVGTMHLKDLEPGFITLSVISSGYKSDNRQIYLRSSETQSMKVELVKGLSETITLISDPPGADVYFGALWVGQTPLYTEKPADQSQIRISKKDFMSFYADSATIEGSSLTVQLGTDIFDIQKELELNKKKFYKSLGWFSMSVAIPLVLSGVYQNLNNRYYQYAQDYNSTYNTDSYDKALEYKTKSDIAYYSLWGGVAISGGLLVNTIFKLRDYIRTAEKSTED